MPKDESEIARQIASPLELALEGKIHQTAKGHL